MALVRTLSQSMIKPTKWPVCPGKTQISLGIHPSDQSSLSTWRSLSSLVTHWVHNAISDQTTDAQADLSLPWTQRLFCWFCHAAARMSWPIVSDYRQELAEVKKELVEVENEIDALLQRQSQLFSRKDELEAILRQSTCTSKTNDKDEKWEKTGTVKIRKFWTPQKKSTVIIVNIVKFKTKIGHPKICCNHPEIWTRLLYQRVMHPKDVDGIANSVDPDQTAPDLGLHCLLRPVCPKT